MNTPEYLAACKTELGIESDYALASRLGITRSAVSQLQNGKAILGDDVALSVAEILGINPFKVIADANAERAKTPEMRSRWLGLAQKLQASFESLLLPVGRRALM
jgi:transcriptional regulator with XRE-family HTH domain